MRPLAIMIGETLSNLKHLWLISTRLDTLVGQLMELMRRWTIMPTNKEVGDSKESKEELGLSKSEEVSRQCD